MGTRINGYFFLSFLILLSTLFFVPPSAAWADDSVPDSSGTTSSALSSSLQSLNMYPDSSTSGTAMSPPTMNSGMGMPGYGYQPAPSFFGINSSQPYNISTGVVPSPASGFGSGSDTSNYNPATRSTAVTTFPDKPKLLYNGTIQYSNSMGAL